MLDAVDVHKAGAVPDHAKRAGLDARFAGGDFFVRLVSALVYGGVFRTARLKPLGVNDGD